MVKLLVAFPCTLPADLPVLFSTMLRLRFLREANRRETSWIIYRRLKKEKVVRERETERESNIAEGAFLKFQTNLNKKIKLLAST